MKLNGLVMTGALVALMLASPTRAHEGDTHTHKSPHGGVVKTAGNYHLELVRTGTGFEVYLLDGKESTLPIQGITGKVTGLTKAKTKLDLELKPGTDHFVIDTDAEALEGGTLIVALRKGEEPITAKFIVGEHAHH